MSASERPPCGVHGGGTRTPRKDGVYRRRQTRCCRPRSSPGVGGGPSTPGAASPPRVAASASPSLRPSDRIATLLKSHPQNANAEPATGVALKVGVEAGVASPHLMGESLYSYEERTIRRSKNRTRRVPTLELRPAAPCRRRYVEALLEVERHDLQSQSGKRRVCRARRCSSRAAAGSHSLPSATGITGREGIWKWIGGALGVEADAGEAADIVG